MANAVEIEILRPYGYQQITSLSSSTALTVPVQAREAIVQAATQGVRWRDDGTAPTASVGGTLAAGQAMTIRGDLSLKNIRFIELIAGAVLDVSYYG